ncbi:putative histone-lysine N-methyltransferase PRDM7 [Amphibalanus amphitrite]|uniref:Putative histone-lysine N-methyltransferase PRDM7 n=1 Tax=Amphibalanus amphitrite TaxID=1232801 RepID=A0A6A4VFE8_AMPAM|nr:putative histone-lysine N-methyltransferase PRDM7 [Amphibalanus amphitrite]
MQAASTPPPEPPVEPKWSHEESADEELSVTRCARQSERGIDSTVMDTSNDTDILVAAKEVKIEVTSIKVKKGDRVHHSVNAEDPSCSNWLRRVNCARSEEEQNLVAFQHKGQIYFRTSKPIPRGSELLVYYGDDSARELTVHSETSVEPAASLAPGPSSSVAFLSRAGVMFEMIPFLLDAQFSPAQRDLCCSTTHGKLQTAHR